MEKAKELDTNEFESQDVEVEKPLPNITESEPASKAIPLGKRIKKFVSLFFESKEALGLPVDNLTESDTVLIKREVENMEKVASVDGVDFSRIQIDKVLADRESGKKIEFENLSQYISDYNMVTGEIWEDKLTNADRIGLRLGKTFRNIFPKARLISLWDAYNTSMPDTTDARGVPTSEGKQVVIPENVQERFKENSIALQKKAGGISKDGIEGIDYLYISESSKVNDAEDLVQRLENAGYIIRKGEEIKFVNKEAENPLYRDIQLRTKNGRWLCEALDASSYIKPENLEITHIVVLPESFKDQQNKVWEILRVLGIKPLNYHNIFYDDSKKPEEVAKIVEDEFAKHGTYEK